MSTIYLWPLFRFILYIFLTFLLDRLWKFLVFQVLRWVLEYSLLDRHSDCWSLSCVCRISLANYRNHFLGFGLHFGKITGSTLLVTNFPLFIFIESRNRCSGFSVSISIIRLPRLFGHLECVLFRHRNFRNLTFLEALRATFLFISKKWLFLL